MRKTSIELPTDHLPEHLLKLLEGMRRRMQEELTAEYGERRPFVRPSFGRMLQLIPPEGVRITEYAALARMTKQAAGEYVDSLESSGLAVSERLPSDRRVRMVRRTTEGDAVAADVSKTIGTIEERLRAEVGPRRYDTMVSVLRELGADSFG